MMVLLFVVLIPAPLFCAWILLAAEFDSSFGALGTAYARWRYPVRFEHQFAELMNCLEQGLGSQSGTEALETAERCFAEAEQRGAAPFAIHVLAPTANGKVEWQQVRYIDSSFGLENLHERAWSEGLHMYTPPLLLGRCLLYVHTLPVQGEPAAKARAYSLLVQLRRLR